MSKKTRIVFILILILQTLFYIYMGTFKLGYHMDEIYSYGLANSYNGAWATIDEGREYKPHELFSDYVNVNKDHKFDYSIDWKNQAEDVHPPIYYVLLHTICIVFNSDFSKWPGIVLNIIFAIFITWGVYKVSQKYLEDENKAIIITAINAFSLGTCNTVMYIRMYALFTVWVIWFTFLIYSTLKDKKKFDRGFAFKYIALLTCGVMTQYYFMIFAFFVCFFIAIKLFLEKEFEQLKKLIVYSVVSGVLCVIFFPYILKHLFRGGRGKESFSALFTLEDWVTAISKMLIVVRNQVMAGISGLIVVAVLIISVVALCKIRKQKIELNQIAIFNLSSIAYFLMISKIAPYASDRYIFGIFPIIVISTFGFILKHIDTITNSKKINLLPIVGIVMIALVALNYRTNTVPYIYSRNQEYWNYEEKYKNVPCLYVLEGSTWHAFWDFPQLREYELLRFINTKDISCLDDKELNKYDEAVIFVQKEVDTKSVMNSIIRQNAKLNSYELLYKSGGSEVYYCK